MVANLSAARIDVTLPEEHQAPWREVVADHAYGDDLAENDSTVEAIHLHGYGYRWFCRAAS